MPKSKKEKKVVTPIPTPEKLADTSAAADNAEEDGYHKIQLKVPEVWEVYQERGKTNPVALGSLQRAANVLASEGSKFELTEDGKLIIDTVELLDILTEKAKSFPLTLDEAQKQVTEINTGARGLLRMTEQNTFADFTEANALMEKALSGFWDDSVTVFEPFVTLAHDAYQAGEDAVIKNLEKHIKELINSPSVPEIGKKKSLLALESALRGESCPKVRYALLGVLRDLKKRGAKLVKPRPERTSRNSKGDGHRNRHGSDAPLTGRGRFILSTPRGEKRS